MPSLSGIFHRQNRLRTLGPEEQNMRGHLIDESNSPSGQLRRLVSEGRLSEAKHIATDALAKDGNSLILLRELAAIESRQGNHQAAAKHLAAAMIFGRSNIAVTAEYAQSLERSGCGSEAISFISRLHDNLRYDPSIRTILGDIYRALGWYAHAVKAYGNLRDLRWNGRYNCIASWWRCGGPWHVRHSRMWSLESRIDDLWRERSSERRSMLETTGLLHQPNQKDINVRLDTSLLWLLTAQVQLEDVERGRDLRRGRLKYIGLAWLVAAFMLYAFYLRNISISALVTGSFLLAAMAIFIMTYLGNLAEYTIARGMRFQFTFYTWFVVSYVGFFFVIFFSANSPARFVGLLLLEVGITSALWHNLFYECLRRVTRRRQTYLREFVLGNFLDLLIDLRDSNNIHEPQVRKQWIALLKDTAFTIERFLPRYISSSDPVIREWISARARDIASTIRLMACNVAVPSEGYWERLTAELGQSVTAVACGDFGALPKSESPLPTQWPSRRQRLLINLTRVAVAFTLLAALIGVLVAFKKQNMVQLAGAAAITTLIPILVGVLVRPLRGEAEGAVDNTDS